MDTKIYQQCVVSFASIRAPELIALSLSAEPKYALMTAYLWLQSPLSSLVAAEAMHIHTYIHMPKRFKGSIEERQPAGLSIGP
jgi:hypothetical protein